MSLGSWEPAADAAAHQIQIETPTLQRLIAFSRDEQLQTLSQQLCGDESQRLAGLMLLDHSEWSKAAEPLADEDILHLIRFFTIAEALPGWEAGPRSPVIPLAKTLRNRGQRLDKALLLWIREVSDNRFLPYGPL